METARQVVGALLVFELAASVIVVGLIFLVGRGDRRVPASALLGVLIFLSLCLVLIYGSLWLILRLGTSE